MEPRKNRVQTSGEKSGKKGFKAIVAAVGITILFGTGTVFGATNWGATITNYAKGLVGIETQTINSVDSSDEAAQLETHVQSAISEIDSAIVGKGTVLKGQVETEITSELNRIKGEVSAAKTAEIEQANTDLQDTADTKILEGKQALDDVANSYFTTVEKTPVQQ